MRPLPAIAVAARTPDKCRMHPGKLIDALSRRAPAIVVFTLIAALLCAWVGAPAWMPTALAVVVGGLALVLFAARGGRNARRPLDDDRSWVAWELADKGTPPGSYILGFFGFITIVLTGFEAPYALPAWAGLALGVAWGIANRHYPAEDEGDL